MGDVVSLPPPVVDFDATRVPEELKQKPRWLMWRYVVRDDAAKPAKVPFQANGIPAKVNDPSTWCQFASCVAALQTGKFHGVGFVLSDKDDIIAWDLDKCLDPDTMVPVKWADNIIKRLNSYTEVTPSGRGFRIFVRGQLPTKSSGGKGNDNKSIECYQDVRFMTITGNTWPTTPIEINAHDDGLWNSIFAKDDPLVKKMKRDEKFKRLWAGDISDYPDGAGGFDHSSADLGLCRLLVFQTAGDAKKVDELFRRSGLYRPKWDTDHFGGRGTYGQFTIAKALENYVRKHHMTDLGNAKRLALLIYHQAVYCDKLGWFLWDGARLRPDETRAITLRAIEVPRQIEAESEQVEGDEDYAEALLSFARKCESRNSLANMINLCEADPDIAVRVDQLDAKPNLVNLASHTLDLDTGNLREHSFDDLLTKVMPVEYLGDAACPDWDRFIDEITGGDDSLQKYLKRVVGYTLTGLVDEQKFFLLYGTGRNGKSTFYRTIMKMMGDYAKIFPKELVLPSAENQHSTIFADLYGVRMACIPEWDESKRLNEELVKRITGDDPIRARKLYQDSFEFESIAKLWIIGNHKPVIRGTDLGIWRRVQMIPFTVTIDPAKDDKKLKYKLREQLPGVLRWAIEGLVDWRLNGLNPPPRVTAFTEEYRTEQDVFATWLDDEIEASPKSKILHKELYARYVRTMEGGREFVLKNRDFAQKLRERGLRGEKSTGNQLYWFDVKFRIDESQGHI